MKLHPIFPNLVLIGVFSFGLLASPARIAPKTTLATPALTNITAVAAGTNHTCALTASGWVKCWGNNDRGQLGDGTYNDRKTPWLVSGLSNVVAIAAGRLHTCALTSTGGIKCWGDNGNGQLGDGTDILTRNLPVNVLNLTSGVTAISAGGDHTCALTSAGAMKCWGNNYYGELGDGTTTDRPSPVTVSGMASGVDAISAGDYHTCAVTTTGRAKCWGNNRNGRLGDGTTTDRHSPVTVSGMASGVDAIFAGGEHTCARMSNNQIKCWGRNLRGQLGDNTTTDRHTPVNVIWLGSVPSAASLGWWHTCALNTGGGVDCWGANSYGQLGDGTTNNRYMPVDVSGLTSGVNAISAGDYHTCALMSGGGVKCWGRNADGQLGDGTTTDRHTPVDVVTPQLTFRSAAAQDGWVLESGENTNAGGSLRADAFLVIGDNATDKQYRSILYFDTSTLPDNAVILRVTLKIKSAGVTGTDPFTTHGNLLADIKEGTFSAADLEITDFEAWVSNDNVGSFSAVSGAPGWYKLTLAASDHAYINLTYITQFRLRFATDDNNDTGADYAAFYAGDAGLANRPQLIVEYTVP